MNTRRHPMDRDIKERKIVKARIENLNRLVISLKENHYNKLEIEDVKDLESVQELLRRILER